MIVDTAASTLTFEAVDVAYARRLLAAARLDPGPAAQLWEHTVVVEGLLGRPLDARRFIPEEAIREARRVAVLSNGRRRVNGRALNGQAAGRSPTPR